MSVDGLILGVVIALALVASVWGLSKLMPKARQTWVRQRRRRRRARAAETAETVRVFDGEWKRLRPGLREYIHGAMKHDPRFGLGTEVDLEPVKVLRIR